MLAKNKIRKLKDWFKYRKSDLFSFNSPVDIDFNLQHASLYRNALE